MGENCDWPCWKIMNENAPKVSSVSFLDDVNVRRVSPGRHRHQQTTVLLPDLDGLSHDHVPTVLGYLQQYKRNGKKDL